MSEVWKQYSRFSELAPKALNIGYNVCRSTYSVFKCLKSLFQNPSC